MYLNIQSTMPLGKTQVKIRGLKRENAFNIHIRIDYIVNTLACLVA